MRSPQSSPKPQTRPAGRAPAPIPDFTVGGGAAPKRIISSGPPPLRKQGGQAKSRKGTP